MSIIRVGGIHGVGKSTIIHEAVELAGIEVPILKGSDLMAEYLNISPEDLPFQTVEQRQKARENMYKIFQETIIGIRDSHFCVYTDQGYEFPFTIRDKDKIVALVLIWANPEVILERRKKVERVRPLDIERIIEHQKYEFKGAQKGAKKLNVPLYEIESKSNSNEGVLNLSKIFLRYF